MVTIDIVNEALNTEINVCFATSTKNSANISLKYHLSGHFNVYDTGEVVLTTSSKNAALKAYNELEVKYGIEW